MGNKKIFEKLAASLPIDERNTLLNNISKSLKLNHNSEDYIQKEIPRNDLELKVKNDIGKSGWFEKLMLRIYSFFTGKSQVDYFLSRELKRIKKRLNSINGESYFDSDENKLSGRIASEIYSLYVLSAPLRKLFKSIWDDTDFIENIYSNLIGDAIHAKKLEIYDFVSLEDMETIFAATGEKNQIRKKLIHRINEYLNSVPRKTISEINENIFPFYFSKFFILFPFKNFLNVFGCSISDLTDFKSPEFKKTDFSLIIERLELLYNSLNMFTICEWKELYIDIVGGAYLSICEEIEETLIDDKLSILKNELKSLRKAVDEFIKNVPLLDIIRYIRNDSYYDISNNMPKPDFFAFYCSAIKIRILSSFNRIFQEVRKKYINNSIERIFVGYKLFNLNWYREYNDFNYKGLDLVFFKHISSLMLISNFFNQYYKKQIFDIIHILYKTVLTKNPNLQTRFLELVKEIEKTTHEISVFDKTLNPDEEDGKTFSLLKNEIVKNYGLLRKYKNFISEKDLAAERLIFSCLDLIASIRKNFEQTLSNPADIIRLQLSSVYPHINRDKSLREIIKVLIADLSNLTSLLKQNLDVEKS